MMPHRKHVLIKKYELPKHRLVHQSGIIIIYIISIIIFHSYHYLLLLLFSIELLFFYRYSYYYCLFCSDVTVRIN